MTHFAGRHAPAAERNREPILEALRSIVPAEARFLEIGSGTGQHAAFFTAQMPRWTWQTTERDARNLASIEAYRGEAPGDGFLEARLLDATSSDWGGGSFDVVFSANVIHIAPWSIALGILDGAHRVLTAAGALIFYGPFRFSGAFTADSNAAFDARLRHDDPEWGVRDVVDLTREASQRGFMAPEVVPMPANNHVIVFRRI